MQRHAKYKNFVTENLSVQLSGLLDLALSLRTYSPAIAMNHQLLRDHLSDSGTTKRCSAFLIVGDSVVCETEDLQQAVSSPKLSPFWE